MAHAPLLPDAKAVTRAPGPELLRRWATTPPGQQRKLLLGFIRDEVTRTIGLPGDLQLDPRQPFNELGLDSLMAVELRNVLSTGLATSLPTTLLFDYPTAEALAGFLMRQVPALVPASSGPAARSSGPSDHRAEGTVAHTGVTDLNEISDDEAEALLLAELEQLKDGH
jgi:hypothetical protein